MCSHLINKETQKYLADINFNRSAVNLPDLVGWSGDIIPRPFQLNADVKLRLVWLPKLRLLKIVDKYWEVKKQQDKKYKQRKSHSCC